jgi:hypothetical protein
VIQEFRCNGETTCTVREGDPVDFTFRFHDPDGDVLFAVLGAVDEELGISIAVVVWEYDGLAGEGSVSLSYPVYCQQSQCESVTFTLFVTDKQLHSSAEARLVVTVQPGPLPPAASTESPVPPFA